MKCLFCNKEIVPDKTHPKRKRKFCSSKCMYSLWKQEGRQNYKGDKVKQWKGGMSNAICRSCGKNFRFYFSTKRGLFCSRSCSGEYTRNNKLLVGNKNPSWKGNAVGYGVLHKWVRRHKPQLDVCERCNLKTKQLDLANKSQKYIRNIDDFWYLCRKCHHQIDWQNERRAENGKWISPKIAPSRIRLRH